MGTSPPPVSITSTQSGSKLASSSRIPVCHSALNANLTGVLIMVVMRSGAWPGPGCTPIDNEKGAPIRTGTRLASRRAGVRDSEGIQKEDEPAAPIVTSSNPVSKINRS